MYYLCLCVCVFAILDLLEHYTPCVNSHTVLLRKKIFRIQCRTFYTGLNSFTQPAVVIVVKNMMYVRGHGGLTNEIHESLFVLFQFQSSQSLSDHLEKMNNQITTVCICI